MFVDVTHSMAEPPGPRRRPPAAGASGHPGRNKSFRKAREAIEEAHYLDVSLDDVQKYFSPDTWKKMTNMHLHSVPPSSVQKYFDPVAWEKLQRLGCLRGRPSTSASPSSEVPGRSSSSSVPVTAARDCFSPRSWEKLGRINVVPPPQWVSEDPIGDPHDDDEDGYLGCDMDDTISLSSAVRLEGLEDLPAPRATPRAAVSDSLRQYFTSDQWRKLEEQGILESALGPIGKETSV